MTNSLSIYKDFEGLQRAAMALYKSGFFTDLKSEAQAIVKVMAGSELGLPPFASMTGIHIIKGKPVLGSNLLATLVKNDARYDYKVEKADAKICTITWYENGKAVGHNSFTIEEAAAAELTGKDNWKHYAEDMLFARAISRGARRFAPGIFGGAPVYTEDEMGVTIEGELEDVEDPVEERETIYDIVVEAGLSENEHAARKALEKCKTGYNTPEAAIAWMRIYRAWRDMGLNPDPAAIKANAGEVPPEGGLL